MMNMERLQEQATHRYWTMVHNDGNDEWYWSERRARSIAAKRGLEVFEGWAYTSHRAAELLRELGIEVSSEEFECAVLYGDAATWHGEVGEFGVKVYPDGFEVNVYSLEQVLAVYGALVAPLEVAS